MVKQTQLDRTSVTISKETHHKLKVAAANLGITQRALLEHIVYLWLSERHAERWPEGKEEE